MRASNNTFSHKLEKTHDEYFFIENIAKSLEEKMLTNYLACKTSKFP